MATPVWQATIKDDISAQTQRMAFSLKALDTTASSLFKKADGNFKKFEADLKKMGVDTMDAKLVTEKYRKELEASRRELLGLGKAAEQTGSKLRQVSIGALRAIGEKAMNVPGQLVSGAVGAIGAIGGKVMEVGKGLVDSVIEAAQFKQNAITGFEYMLGSRSEAERIFAGAQKLASETPLDTDKVITGIKQLATAGFTGDESMLLFKAVADQAAKFADDEGMQDKVIASFSRIKGRGVATGEDLESLRVAGFRAEGVVESLLNNPNLAPLFKKVKVSGIAGGKAKWVDRSQASQEDIIKQVKETMGEGKIGSYTLLNAAIASLEKKENIGQFASKMGAKSLTGTISNFKSAFGDLLKSTNIDEWQGIKAFQEFLTRITAALQGDAGKQLLGTVQRIINALLGGLSSIKSAEIGSFIKMIGDLGDRAVGVIKQAWEWLDKLLHGGSVTDTVKDMLIDVAKLIGAGIRYGVMNAGDILKSRDAEQKATFQANSGGLSREFFAGQSAKYNMTPEALAEAFSKAKSAFYASGGSVDFSKGGSAQEAIWNAIGPTLTAQLAVSAREKMLAVGNAAAEGLETGVKQPLQIQSPSKTMAYVGEMAAKGLLDGTERGVEKGNAEGLRNGGKSVSVQVNIGSVGGDPDAVGQAIGNVVVREVMAQFERMADEG